MIDLKQMRKNPEEIIAKLKKRNVTPEIDKIIALDIERRRILAEVEILKNERNKVSAEVGQLKRDNKEITQELLFRIDSTYSTIKELDLELREIDERLLEMLLSIPNTPHESVPFGQSENDNIEYKIWGEKPVFSFKPKEHWEFVESLGGLNFKAARKISGSRFVLLTKWAAHLERALANFMLDVHIEEHNYTEIFPPVIVNRESLIGTGQLPKFEADLFKIENSNYYLIPTAEVPVTNLLRDEIVAEKELPITYCAYSSCFRSEAGSYGKDVKGIFRQHQFLKVELVRFVHPDSSYSELETILDHAEKILQLLGLHYRVVTLCGGDLGFSAAKTYDIEVWLPGQNKYREISSCSNFEDFQARRANIKFKAKDGKTNLLHTLNGSGLAVGRTMIAIVENYQQADGTIVLPDVLVPYMRGLKIIKPE